MSDSPLLTQLPAGPLDIIGDVHGEHDALEAILDKLGQSHPRAGQPHLVFLGDLVDRGPDSIAVVDRVASLIEEGRATCVMGNHELNLLRKRQRSGNAWFYGTEGEAWTHAVDGTVLRGRFQSRVATESDRTRLLDFFATLPLAATRHDLRIVHAAWHPTAIAALADCGSFAEALARSDADAADLPEELRERCKAEVAELKAAGIDTNDPAVQPPHLEALAQAAEIAQNSHHLTVLTSGPEQVRPGLPAWRAGRWRIVQRQRWWDEHVDVTTIFGHYWRLRQPSADSSRQRLFGATEAHDWLGPHRRAFCVDFSVGRRYHSRGSDGSAPEAGFREALGALRWTGPDKPSQLWFDDRPDPVMVPPPGQ